MPVREIEQRVAELVASLGLSEAISNKLMESITEFYIKGLDNIEVLVGMNFTDARPEVLSYLKEYNFNLVKNMNDELANKLRSSMQRNLLTGDKKNLTKEIRTIFDTTENRARAIARTESARAYAVGNYVGAKEAQRAGVKVRKYWLAVNDNRTSPLCQRLSKKYSRENAIDIDKEFIDPKGEWRGYTNPGHINCRSEAVYIV